MGMLLDVSIEERTIKPSCDLLSPIVTRRGVSYATVSGEEVLPDDYPPRGPESHQSRTLDCLISTP